MIPFVVWWVVWIVAGVVLEAIGLRRQDDEPQPLTVYVREVMGYSYLFRVVVLGAIAWAFFHFAIGLP